MSEINAVVSPRFEICYALAARARAQAHEDRTRSPWLEMASRLGEAFWVAVPDALGDAAAEPTFDDFLAALETVPDDAFFDRVARGLFHENDPDASRREWLAYIGAEDRQGVVDYWRRLADPSLKRVCLRTLQSFWQAEFAPIWADMLPQLRASAARTQRLANTCRMSELAAQLLLRAEFDEDASVLRALRGGYSLPLGDVGTFVLLPSAFNTRRLWHAADARRPATVFFPYFDADISIHEGRETAGEEFDPWLICRALGDPTRSAVVRRLARGETATADLVAELDLSKGTVSHHIFHLREAGLILEEREGRSVRLRLRTERLRMLSARLLHALDLAEGEIA